MKFAQYFALSVVLLGGTAAIADSGNSQTQYPVVYRGRLIQGDCSSVVCANIYEDFNYPIFREYRLYSRLSADNDDFLPANHRPIIMQFQDNLEPQGLRFEGYINIFTLNPI